MPRGHLWKGSGPWGFGMGPWPVLEQGRLQQQHRASNVRAAKNYLSDECPFANPYDFLAYNLTASQHFQTARTCGLLRQCEQILNLAACPNFKCSCGNTERELHNEQLPEGREFTPAQAIQHILVVVGHASSGLPSSGATQD